MATTPTTKAAIRDRIAAVIAAAIPASFIADTFREWTDEESAEFDRWALANPQASWRRFQVKDDGTGNPPAVSGLTVEERLVTFVTRIAYPHDARAGMKNDIDRRRVMGEDEQEILAVIGWGARENFSTAVDASRPDACWRSGRVTREERAGCDFLVIEQTMSFQLAV